MKPFSMRNWMTCVRSFVNLVQHWRVFGITRFGLKLNFLMPSSSVVFLCFAVSNLLGSSVKSGVGCLNVSELPAVAVDIRSTELSGVIESRRTSSLLRCARDAEADAADSTVDFGAVVPHATSERRTVTRHSKPCRFSWASEWPMFDVSMLPAMDIACVLSAGGTLPCEPFCGAMPGLGGGSLPLPGSLGADVEPILEMMFIRLQNVSSVLAAASAYSLLVDVVSSLAITIVVQINFYECLGVLA